MGVHTATAPSAYLQGPAVPIDERVKLHRLFERNENAYPEHMAVIHEGIVTYRNIVYVPI